MLRILHGWDAREPEDNATWVYPLLATYLLTDDQSAEVLGLEVADVSFDRQVVTFRPNQ